MKNASLRKIIFAALMAALTTVATMIIRIPTPTQGYIHLGDGMVLLCGALLFSFCCACIIMPSG